MATNEERIQRLEQGLQRLERGLQQLGQAVGGSGTSPIATSAGTDPIATTSEPNFIGEGDILSKADRDYTSPSGLGVRSGAYRGHYTQALAGLTDAEKPKYEVIPADAAAPWRAAVRLRSGELAPGWTERRYDEVVPAGTSGTVTLPKTGHVLSLPKPNPSKPLEGEMFMGYAARVHKQAGAPNADSVGALAQQGSALFEKFGGHKADGSNWPEAADAFYNPRAYMTDAERAKDDANAAGWAARDAKRRDTHPAGGPSDSGVDVPIEQGPT